MQKGRIVGAVTALLVCLLFPSIARAQSQLTGVVKDTSGAVMGCLSFADPPNTAVRPSQRQWWRQPSPVSTTERRHFRCPFDDGPGTAGAACYDASHSSSSIASEPAGNVTASSGAVR